MEIVPEFCLDFSKNSGFCQAVFLEVAARYAKFAERED